MARTLAAAGVLLIVATRAPAPAQRCVGEDCKKDRLPQAQGGNQQTVLSPPWASAPVLSAAQLPTSGIISATAGLPASGVSAAEFPPTDLPAAGLSAASLPTGGALCGH